MKSVLKVSVKGLLVAGLVFSSIGQTASYAVSQPEQGQKSYKETLEKLGINKTSTQSIVNEKDNSEVFQDNLLVIKYKKGISSNSHKKMGTTLVKKISSLQYDVVQVADKDNLEKVAASYLKRDDVQSVSRSAKISRLAVKDQKRSSMYHLDTIKADEATKLTGKNKVRVAVIDTGIDVSHPELKNKVVYNYNVMNPLKKGAPDLHGTHVAGIIAAEKNNELGGYGVNPNVDILSIDVFNRSFNSSDYTVAEGILEAIKQKAQVINLSLGSTYASPIIEEAIKKAVEANITVVAAAGNSGSEMLEYPAAFNGVISVGATNEDNKLADFSTYGASVDVVAPGEDIYSTAYNIDRGSTFMELDGTSMASPVVAGAVSLLLAKNPSLTPQQVQYILNKTATDLGSKGYDTTYGFGLINPVNAIKYDIGKLPKVEILKENQVVEKAKKIELNGKSIQNGAINNLYQTDWYQVSVDQSEYVQLDLKPIKEISDYQFELYFFPEGEKEKASEHIIVNDVTAGLVEGSLYKAPEAGTIVIGVKDALKKYNETAKQTYSLSLSKFAELKDDGITEENMVNISHFPFKSGELFLTEEPVKEEQEPTEETPETDEIPVEELVLGDSDYFTFSVPESSEISETYKFNTSGIPGIDITLNLHMVEVYEDEGEVFEEKVLYESANSKGFGQGETLSFNGSPGATYIVEVTNNPLSEFFMWGYLEQEIDLTKSFSSTIPYHVTVEKNVLPNDEDQFPEVSYDYSEEITEEYVEQAVKNKESIRKGILEDLLALFEGEDDYFSFIPDIAMPFSIGEDTSGYFQYSGDEDWYTFQLEKTGFYEFSYEGTPTSLEIYQQDSVTGDFSMIATNVYYDMVGESQIEKIYAGLKADQTYYMKLSEPMYRPNLDEYTISANYLADSPEDRQELNDQYTDATELEEGAISGNFSTEQDLDIFYYKPSKDGIYGYHMQPVSSNNTQLPKQIQRETDPVVFVIEDIDGDKELDVEEEGNMIITDIGLAGDEERGSFKGTKGKGYFVVLFNYDGSASIQGYNFSFASSNIVDEDKGAGFRNNIPIKPMDLKVNKDGNISGTGYMNYLANKGDIDFYKLVIKDDKQGYKVKLDLPLDLDGKLSVYNAIGKEIVTKDQYGPGDSEEFYINLKKGTYFIKIEDVNQASSISPYQLTIK